MFRVIEDCLAGLNGKTNRFFNHRKVFFRRYAKGLARLKEGRFPNDRQDRGATADKRPQTGVLIRAHPLTSCHSESANLRRLKAGFPNLLKIRLVFLIRGGISSFNIINPQLVEARRRD